MACPRCGSGAAPLHGQCAQCGASVGSDTTPTAIGLATPLPLPNTDTGITQVSNSITQPPKPDDDVTRLGGTPPEPPPTVAVPRATPTSVQHSLGVTVGQSFGSRYHIIRVLGIGGMGAVYQAWDQALEVAVALKVIRPESAPDAQTAEALQRRFKHELLLARQVTHKNVVRIHDLGEVDGITYITMPYVQGSDLATVVAREGRLTVERAVAIAKELASGLIAAHAAGVVHRDLKPANIMIDGEGGVLIMDFGIARSTSGATAFGMTASGVIVGTVEYMAPEQAKGERVDARADIYSFGLILNDILLGRRQSTSTGVAELMTRMQQPLPSLRSMDATIPAWLDAIVHKCIQPDPAERYQSMTEVLEDLEAKSGRPVTVTTRTISRPVGSRSALMGALAAVVVFGLLAGGWFLRTRLVSGRRAQPQTQSQAIAAPSVTLAILPFRNASGDATLDSLGPSVSDVLRTELGQSSHVMTVPSNRVLQVLQDLRIQPNTTLAPTELARVADFMNARSVLWGQLTRFGEAIRIDATLQDLDKGQTVPLNAMAPNTRDLLASIGSLADSVRENLAHGSTDILTELKSTSWKPSTSSFEALRLYNEGQQLTQQGNHQAALKSFEAATKIDDHFALALSAMAKSYSTLGYDDEAGQATRRAISLSDGLPALEKYRIAATHYQIVRDTPKAIESYENLVKASPNSPVVQFDLGDLYEQTGQFDKAREQYATVVRLDPKFAEGLRALGRIEIKRGSPQDALEPLNKALSLAVEINNEEARANVLQAIGIAYKQLNRPEEAIRRYEESLAIKRKLGPSQRRGMASSIGEIAQVQEMLGKPREAEARFKEALKILRDIGDKAGVASTLTNLGSLLNETLGRPDEALPYFKESLQLRRELGNSAGEALVLNNLGGVYQAKGQYADAQTHYELALQIREKANNPKDMADTVHNLAETLLKRGKYEDSLRQYGRALDLRRKAGDKRGAAIESYSIGTIFDNQGRYGAAITSKDQALTTFRELKQRDFWLGEILSGYGNSLALSGRFEDADKLLDEAMTVGRELPNLVVIVQTQRFQADRLFYAGDIRAAAARAAEAVQSAGKASDRSLALLAQGSAATVTVSGQPTRAIATRLATLAQEADSLGLRSLSVDCSLLRVDALLKLKDVATAREEASRAVAKADALGLRMLVARARYLRGTALRLFNDSEAPRDYAAALRLLDEIKGEDGNQNVMKRADLAAMYADCQRYSKG
jgi:eukaryotic-like serine/threonine-protein kinase